MNRIEDLRIPDKKLVIHPERWKIMSVSNTAVSVHKQGGWKSEEIEFAMIMPQKPRSTNTVGFTMMLAEVKDGELSTNAAHSIRFSYRDGTGFDLEGAGFSCVYLDKKHALKDYRTMGYGPRIEALKQVADKHREVLSAKDARQEDWEKSASELVPYVAKFFDLAPDEESSLV